MAVVAARARRRGARGLRALGAAVHGDRRGDRRRRAARALDGEVVGSIPAALLTDECPRYEVEQRGPAGAAAARRPDQRRAEDVGVRAVRPAGRLAHGAASRPRRGRAADRRDARARRLARRPAARLAQPVRCGLRRPSMEAALNVACAGGEPLALTDCLNFGDPEQARDRLGARAARSTGSREAAESLGMPVVSGNVSLYNETAARRSRRRRSSAASGSCDDVTRIPGRWRAATVSSCCAGAGTGSCVRVAERAAVHARARRLGRRRRDSRSARRPSWSGTAAPQVTDCTWSTSRRRGRCPAGAAPAWDDVVELGKVA